MALEISPLPRNISAKATWWIFEFEHLAIIGGLTVAGTFIGNHIHRQIGALPVSVILQFGIPLFSTIALALFQYGKPKRYLRHLLESLTKPKLYCALEKDREITQPYLID